MNFMVTHGKIIPYNDEYNHGTYYRFSPETLHPFDRMKLILEQWFYYTYCKAMSSSSSLLPSFLRSLESETHKLSAMPPFMPEALKEMYAMGMRLIQQLQNEEFESMSYTDAYVIFNQPQSQVSEESRCLKEYQITMNMTFLIEWFVAFGKMSFAEQYTDGQLRNAAIFLPSPVVVQNYNPEICKEENNEYAICINLETKPIISFDVTQQETFSRDGLFGFLSRCVFSLENKLTLDDIIGYIASFSLDHDHYVMKRMDPNCRVDIVDVCYDLVTGSSFTKDIAGILVNHDIFIQLLRQYVKTGQLLPCQDRELFGALVEHMGADPAIVNYFVQPDEATGAEAFAFRRSIYAPFFEEKCLPGMAAIEDGTVEKIDAENNGDDTEDAGTDLDTESSIRDVDSTETAEKPEIDPDKMLLELAEPNETMADYIYREMVNQRISALLRNPPESARPNDLLMLKRWRSRWLYLTSIACLRDFLSRVALRLSEV